ncbi:MAG: TonB-dependent receptor [Halioglobus sp.]|nr:TonB-dependent receptor [Halioglobus sp.]
MRVKNYPLLVSTVLSLAVTFHAKVQAESSLVLEEIIVTAQKRLESLEDTPITINVVTGEALDEYAIFSFDELSNMTAGLTINGTNFDTDIATRGMGTNLNAPVSPRVTTYMDGTFISQSRNLYSGLFDLQQLELLRGPQGTLYGKSSPAGALTIRTANPNLEKIDGSIRQSFNDRDGTNTQVAASLPLIKNELGLRVSGLYDNNEDSDVYNSTLDKHAETKTKAYRLVMLWEPTNNFDARLSWHHIKDDADADPVVEGAGLDFDDRIALAEFDSTYKNKAKFLILESNYTFSNEWVATFSYSYQDAAIDRYYDQDATAVQAREQYVPSPTEANIYELRLASQDNDFWNWTVGAYYGDSDSNTKVDVSTYLFDPRIQGTVVRADTDSSASLTGEDWALFSHNSINVSENGTLTVGLRYNDVKRDAAQPFLTDVYLLTPAGELLVQSRETDGVLPGAQHLSDNAVTGSLKYQYNFHDDLMAYTAFDTGWRDGSANIAGNPQPPVFGAFDSEDSYNLEIGFKWKLWDGRGLFNFAAYYQLYDQFQYQAASVSYRDQDGNISLSDPVVNVDEAESYGFDTDFSVLISEHWNLNSSLSFNQTELTDAGDVPCTDGEPIGAAVWSFNTCDLTGERASGLPEWSANVSSEYWGSVRSISSEWYLRGLLNAETEYYSPVFRDDLDSYVTLDLYVGLRSVDAVWDVNVWVKNIADESAKLKDRSLPDIPDYSTGVMVPSPYVEIRSQIAPRTYGITLSYNFGL